MCSKSFALSIPTLSKFMRRQLETTEKWSWGELTAKRAFRGTGLNHRHFFPGWFWEFQFCRPNPGWNARTSWSTVKQTQHLTNEVRCWPIMLYYAVLYNIHGVWKPACYHVPHALRVSALLIVICQRIVFTIRYPT